MITQPEHGAQCVCLSLVNGRAEDISGILDKVFTAKKPRMTKNGRIRPLCHPQPSGKRAKAEKSAESSTRAGACRPHGIGNGQRHRVRHSAGEVNITADEIRNALIIEATPGDYQVIKKLRKKLDVMPRQVLIEVTFAEITLDDSTSMGVEWSYKKGTPI
ncbi:MAG: secretin N-terminal domain-containing protein [Desulfobacterales bacterium]